VSRRWWYFISFLYLDKQLLHPLLLYGILDDFLTHLKEQQIKTLGNIFTYIKNKWTKKKRENLINK
jgi:hypothetical protein